MSDHFLSSKNASVSLKHAGKVDEVDALPVQFIQSYPVQHTVEHSAAPRVTRAFLPSSMICIAWKNAEGEGETALQEVAEETPRPGLWRVQRQDLIDVDLLLMNDPATGWKPLPHEQLIVTFHSQILHTRDLGNSAFKLIHVDPKNWGSKVTWQFYAHPLRMSTGNP